MGNNNICTTIFYGYGLGRFGKLGVLAGCGLTLVIYTAQLFASHWYFRDRSTGHFALLGLKEDQKNGR
ncbi:DUF418 domain-containing protein [Brevibacillus brevis]|uniref:DUF418 domain-containing protein n=1 Tax=Brevibacillus brevis TaxID=1393 RepID=UPI00059F1593|nr:DUF418 domain-containing protein [Brevibacillus brevis]